MKIKSYIYRIAIILVLVLFLICGYTLINRAFCEHIFSDYVSDENATYFSDGTKSATCDKGCGKNNKIKDDGSQLKLSKPQKLSATQTAESVTLEWDTVEAATGYNIYCVNNDSAEELVDSTNKTAYTVENLTSATKISFAVRSYIKEGDTTLQSDEAALINTSTKCVSVKNLSSSSSSSAVKLTWEKVEGADGYEIYVKNTDIWDNIGKCTDDTSFTVKKLSSGETYTFSVRSYIETDSNVYSDYESINVTTKLKAPETKIELLSKNNIKLTFQAVEKAEGYLIYSKLNDEKYEHYKELESPGDISISLKSDNYYTYAVRAYHKVGEEILYSEYEPVAVHCSETGDRIIVDPTEGEWNLVLVNKQRELPQGFSPMLDYIPGGYMVDYRVASYYNKMYDDAAEEGIYLAPISGYRSNEVQKEIFKETVEGYMYSEGITRSEAEKITSTEVLIPGTSEHNLGFAIDIGCCAGSFGDSEEYIWLAENAHKYGFIERYTADKQEITGIIPEPWHWRFVGVEYAEKIKNSGLCLEEYLEKYNLIP